MRGMFGLVGLLLVVTIVGLLAKKQLGSLTQVTPPAATSAGVAMPTTTPGATVKEQSQQIQQQYKQQVESAVQQVPRAMPDETK
jgi:hypothetical protein